MSGPFKMKGFSGFGNSPVKSSLDRKEQATRLASAQADLYHKERAVERQEGKDLAKQHRAQGLMSVFSGG